MIKQKSFIIRPSVNIKIVEKPEEKIKEIKIS